RCGLPSRAWPRDPWRERHRSPESPFAETFHLTGAPGRRERGGRKGSRLSSVVSLNARPARESFAGASGVDAGNGTDFNFFICM
ncbi:unnamed protein product, partial [Prorocentrum cordatum]